MAQPFWLSSVLSKSDTLLGDAKNAQWFTVFAQGPCFRPRAGCLTWKHQEFYYDDELEIPCGVGSRCCFGCTKRYQPFSPRRMRHAGLAYRGLVCADRPG